MVSISDLVREFESCYSMLEICCVMYRENNRNWNNVLTTFKISDKTVTETKFEKLLSSGNLRIIKITTEFSNLDTYLERLNQGVIRLNGQEINFGKSFDYDSLTIREDPYHNVMKYEDASTFFASNSYSVFSNNDRDFRSLFDELTPYVITLGFSDIYDYISHHTGVKSFSTQFANDFLFVFPAYFKLEKIEIDNEVLTFETPHKKSVNDLQVNLIGTSKDNRTIIFREHRKVENKEKMRFELRDIPPDSKIEITLFSLRLPELQLNETKFMPINKPQQPFIVAFDQFHKLEEMKKSLLNPELIHTHKRGRVYEKAVCDLLSLCGLSTIHLGKEHEKLILENMHEIGSADILAYDGIDHLFVIDCDTMVPDPKKMEQLIYLCDYLRRLGHLNKIKRIIPVIASPKHPSNNNTEVMIMSNGIIQRLFDGIHYKSKKELVNLLTKQHIQQMISLNRFNVR